MKNLSKYGLTLKNLNVVVIGLGKTGLSCVNYLLKKEAKVRALDTRKNLKLSQTNNDLAQIEIGLGELNLDWLLSADLIVASPGIDLRISEIQRAIKQGIPVVGDIELFCWAINSFNANKSSDEKEKKIIALTGSNGKTTVTNMCYQILKDNNCRVSMGGNVGIEALSLNIADFDYFVLELSSFQLETTYSLNADSAAVLNLSADHLDRYNSYADYVAAKQIIYNNAQAVVYNLDDELTFPKSVDFSENLTKSVAVTPKKYSFSLKEQADFYQKKSVLYYKNEAFISSDQIHLSGQHNIANALASAALCYAVGLNLTQIAQGLANFRGLDHRFQLVLKQHGINFINDSKATNLGSTVAALDGFTVAGNLHLFLGGDAKGVDLSDLITVVDANNIFCYCFGQDGAQIADLLLTKRIKNTDINSVKLSETMQQAFDFASKNFKSGDVVLLSPACSSLDQFKNFEQRGDVFTQLAQAWAQQYAVEN